MIPVITVSYATRMDAEHSLTLVWPRRIVRLMVTIRAETYAISVKAATPIAIQPLLWTRINGQNSILPEIAVITAAVFNAQAQGGRGPDAMKIRIKNA